MQASEAEEYLKEKLAQWKREREIAEQQRRLQILKEEKPSPERFISFYLDYIENEC